MLGGVILLSINTLQIQYLFITPSLIYLIMFDSMIYLESAKIIFFSIRKYTKFDFYEIILKIH